MHPTRRLVALAAIGLLALAGPALAGPHGGRPHAGPRGELGQLQALDLDEDTRARVEALMADSLPQRRELGRQVHEARRALGDALAEPLPDPALLQVLVDELSAARRELLWHRVTTTAALRQMLPEDKRALLIAQLEARRDAHRERRAERRAAYRAQVEQGCGPELAEFCGDLEPGPERGACLRDHPDALSETCTAALRPGRHGHRRGPYGGDRSDF